MNVHRRGAVITVIRDKKIIQVVSGQVRKRWHQVSPNAGMTKRTIVQFFYSVQLRRVSNILRLCGFRVLLMKGDMALSRTVTSFTTNAQHHLVDIERFYTADAPPNFSICTMTFEATR